MRITGGALKGRRIKTCRDNSIRPLLSRLRKSLFDVIGERIKGLSFLDLYAGSGAVGIEALSRGARRAVFVEKDPLAARVIEENIASYKLFSQVKIWRKDVLAFLPILLEGEKFDFIFIAPPYYKKMQNKTLNIIERIEINKATIIVQYSPHENINFTRRNMGIVKQKEHGDTILAFLEGTVHCSSRKTMIKW